MTVWVEGEVVVVVCHGSRQLPSNVAETRARPGEDGGIYGCARAYQSDAQQWLPLGA